MIEQSLLKAFMIKENFFNYKHLLNTKSLSPASLTILKSYEAYYSVFSNQERVDIGDYSAFFFNTLHPNLDDKSVLEFKDIFTRLEENVNSDSVQALIVGFEQQEFYHSMQNLMEQGVNSLELEQKILAFNEKHKGLQISNELLDMDITQALNYVDRSQGMKWRLKPLRDHFGGGLIKGDFGIIAGYVDSGKTSFIASEISHMGQQLKDDEQILWLSNEGDWKSILPRLYCAALNCTQKDLEKHKDAAIKKYTEFMNGNANRIRIVDIQGWGVQQIEALLKTSKPRLLVIDLLDHVQGFNKYHSKESSYEVYNKLYQWAREISTHYCPILGVSQLNGEGENQMYPSMSKLRGSRVDKQAACTFQLMIGSQDTNASLRYLSMPKNKINENKTWKAIVKFDAVRSRFNSTEDQERAA